MATGVAIGVLWGAKTGTAVGAKTGTATVCGVLGVPLGGSWVAVGREGPEVWVLWCCDPDCPQPCADWCGLPKPRHHP
ncbi:hypothetical protein [Shimia sp. R9_3]|uniref:hypothetical protein n=1 Tax=Shimia sp. R9_3 TaxID=2821113 RepID=UPI001ADC73DF|nr:hypothetical protein [Shimia sp. R9_3]MBO9402713.1 hypothetical protein [Shimia sp. R9_3]